ncbi:MAG: hypothetical protein AMXMBFR20_24100 [Planctomycetia bacterium]
MQGVFAIAKFDGEAIRADEAGIGNISDSEGPIAGGIGHLQAAVLGGRVDGTRGIVGTLGQIAKGYRKRLVFDGREVCGALAWEIEDFGSCLVASEIWDRK